MNDPQRPILIDGDTAAGLDGAQALESLGGVQLKGKALPVPAIPALPLAPSPPARPPAP